MQLYELLFVLPGTLAEDEVSPVVASVSSVITERGGVVKSMDDMGKSRLAYPMKHIRYGYFRLCRFEMDPATVPVIRQKLNLMTEILRFMLKKQSAKSLAASRVQIVTPISSVDRSETMTIPMTESADMHRETVAAAEPVAVPNVAPSPAAVAAESKKIHLEDIDKKLDEILEKDIADKV